MSTHTSMGTGSQTYVPSDARRARVTKRRSSRDLAADMLECARGGARQTAIMYGANLDYGLLQEYLSLLVSRGLMQDRDENGLFRTSVKGLRYLREYREFGRLRDSLTHKQRTVERLIE